MSDTLRYTLTHPSTEAPRLPFAHVPAQPHAGNLEVAQRLIRAYRFSDAQRPAASGTDLWTYISGELEPLHRCLMEGDAEALVSRLVANGEQFVWFGGLTTGNDSYSISLGKTADGIATLYTDKLICLAEALGLLSVENPEQGDHGNWGRNITADPERVVEAIEDHLRINIIPPLGIIPASGLQFPDGILHYRHLNALYTASRIRELTSSRDRVCEYGGGLGFVAYYLYLMGRRRTTLFDIPLTNVLSAFFLIRALGNDAVALEGEPDKAGAIRIRASWNCRKEPAGRFALAANQDSFPEISEDIVRGFLAEIERTTSGYFLHINHETEQKISDQGRHLLVPSLVADCTKMRRIYRAPYWLRNGYVEELYRVRPNRRLWSFLPFIRGGVPP